MEFGWGREGDRGMVCKDRKVGEKDEGFWKGLEKASEWRGRIDVDNNNSNKSNTNNNAGTLMIKRMASVVRNREAREKGETSRGKKR